MNKCREQSKTPEACRSREDLDEGPGRGCHPQGQGHSWGSHTEELEIGSIGRIPTDAFLNGWWESSTLAPKPAGKGQEAGSYRPLLLP